MSVDVRHPRERARRQVRRILDQPLVTRRSGFAGVAGRTPLRACPKQTPRHPMSDSGLRAARTTPNASSTTIAELRSVIRAGRWRKRGAPTRCIECFSSTPNRTSNARIRTKVCQLAQFGTREPGPSKGLHGTIEDPRHLRRHRADPTTGHQPGHLGAAYRINLG